MKHLFYPSPSNSDAFGSGGRIANTSSQYSNTIFFRFVDADSNVFGKYIKLEPLDNVHIGRNELIAIMGAEKFGRYEMYIDCSDEIEVDCGGSCQPCVSCDNRIKDGDEEGVDCGGSCPKECKKLKIIALPLNDITYGNWSNQQEFKDVVDEQINFLFIT